MDLTASITGGRGFYVGELQSGFGVHGTTIGSEVTSSDLEMWTWGMVARGARAINYYAFYPMNAGYESGGWGEILKDGGGRGRRRGGGEKGEGGQGEEDVLLKKKTGQNEEGSVVCACMGAR